MGSSTCSREHDSMNERARGAVPEILPGLPEGLPGGLRNYWYPILQTEELPAAQPVAVTISKVAGMRPSGRPKRSP